MPSPDSWGGLSGRPPAALSPPRGGQARRSPRVPQSRPGSSPSRGLPTRASTAGALRPPRGCPFPGAAGPGPPASLTEPHKEEWTDNFSRYKLFLQDQEDVCVSRTCRQRSRDPASGRQAPVPVPEAQRAAPPGGGAHPEGRPGRPCPRPRQVMKQQGWDSEAGAPGPAGAPCHLYLPQPPGRAVRAWTSCLEALGGRCRGRSDHSPGRTPQRLPGSGQTGVSQEQAPNSWPASPHLPAAGRGPKERRSPTSGTPSRPSTVAGTQPARPRTAARSGPSSFLRQDWAQGRVTHNTACPQRSGRTFPTGFPVTRHAASVIRGSNSCVHLSSKRSGGPEFYSTQKLLLFGSHH